MRYLIAILFLFNLAPLAGQSNYSTSCENLIQAAFQDEFDFDNIDAAFNELISILNKADYEEFITCNCADAVWTKSLQDKRVFTRFTHSTKRDTSACLRNLSSQLDIANLNQEFKFQQFHTLSDSLNYVVERFLTKESKRHTPEYNWMHFYHCVEAESKFLKENHVALKEKYWEIFDNRENLENLRDIILTSFFHAGESIEDEVFTRLPAYINERYFYRMLGILMNNGTEKSMVYLIQLMKENNFSLNDKKSILQVIYKINDRIKIKRKTRILFEEYLTSTGLDSLSRYDLFIRD